jgi:glyoxylate reductase
LTQPIPEKGLEMLRAVGEVELNSDPGRLLSEQELMDGVARNDYLYCLLTDKITEKVLAANPKLKVVAQMAVGFDKVDVKAATARGIPVTNTPGVLTETTADTAWVLLMATARRVVEADNYMRSGKYKHWGPLLLTGTDVHGKTLGILGFGRIGKAMARRARGFDMKVLYYDEQRATAEEEKTPGVEYRSFEDVLREADFVTIHTPYMPSTHHLLGEKQFVMMKRTAFVINTARGPIIDEKAMVKALQNGEIAGAGLDVYEREPAMEPALATMQNVVVFPHIGSASVETRTKMAVMAAENVIAVINGKRPPNLVNPDAYKA